MPHVLLGSRHVGALLRHFRANRSLTRRQVGQMLHVSPKTVQNRELGVNDLSLPTLLSMAALFDYDVVLQKRRRPHARPTGTGWPA